MIVHRRSPGLWVFGVDVDSVQLVWRALRPGQLRLRVAHADADADADADVTIEVGDGPGSVVLEHLPAGRLLSVEASGPALERPMTLVARTLLRPPGELLDQVATMSDLHLGAWSFGHRGTIREQPGHPTPHPLRCAEEAMDEALAWGARHLSMKGDLTNSSQPHQWRAYAGLVGRANIPVDAITGNHDYAPPRTRGTLTPSEAAAAHGLSIANPIIVRDRPGSRLVLADTTIPGRNHGSLARVRSQILDAAAEADRHGGLLVVLHHQLQPHVLPEGWPRGVSQSESLAFLDDLGRTHPHVVVTSGHTHRHRRWGRAGVVVTQVGSTKDYPGVWAGYRVYEGGMCQVVRRVADPQIMDWTDYTRTAAFGLWEHAGPGRLDARCFTVGWGQDR